MVVYRVACYERVSTEEQALHGFSVEAQVEALNEYSAKNKIKVVDHYTDAGVSGGKPALKRPEMSRLLEDVKAGKIDMVIFTKLDRWFRNVPEYFKVQEILDAHKVGWKAIHEDFDTTTPNGRMTITIFLALAQNEREKGSYRVKAVLKHKRSKGEACFGGHVSPLGYIKQRDENGVMRLVKDPDTQEAVQAFWDYLIKYQNRNAAAKMVAKEYGIRRPQKAWVDVVRSDFYSGIHRGVKDFCEPYVAPEDWQKFQMPRTTGHATKNNRTYLFTGLLRCPVCNRSLSGTVKKEINSHGIPVEYYSYRCKDHFNAACDWSKSISEKKTEAYLLANLETLIMEEIAAVEMQARVPKPKPKYNLPALREQLRRLEVIYLAGNKSDEEYITEQAEIKALIARAEDEAPPPPKNVLPLKQVLETDFRTLYHTLSREDKRRFWRSIIRQIVVEGNDVEKVIFL